MDIGTISMRYARALIAYAQEEGVEDKLYEELTMLSHSFRNFPQLRSVLENPVVMPADKLKLICTATCGDKKPSKEFVRFIDMVLKQRREVYLHYMSLTYMSLYHKLKHIAVGTLITAVPVDASVRDRIKRIAAATVHARMKLETIVDPSIEGGFLFDINDYRLDASILTQLKRIKHQFIEKNKRIV